MKTQDIELVNGQYLDFTELPFEKNQYCLITAGTGMGKTTVVMEQLPKHFDLVLFLLLSTLKVSELEMDYNKTKKNEASNHLFFYDNKQPKEEDFKNFKGVIVCTYDKFDKVNHLMTPTLKSKCILVVDEVHKVYNTGGFRDNALLPIVIELQERSYASALFLTATFTLERWEVLKISLDNHIAYKKLGRPAQPLEVINLEKGDQYTFIKMIEKRLEDARKLNQPGKPCKKILIRLNNRKKCELVAAYFEKECQAKCLIVHSRNKNDSSVNAMFYKQQIPMNIELLFSTSILDEGINLNNGQDEIDSIYVIGKTAHPEELVQYLGRLRNAVAPCFIVIHTSLTTNHLMDVEKFHQTKQARLKKITDQMSKISGIIQDVSADLDFFSGPDRPKLRTFERVAKLNETFLSWCDAKLFGQYSGKVVQNFPSLAALSYLLDSSASYEDFHYFNLRVKQLLPEAQLRLSKDSHLQTPAHILEFVKEMNEVTKEQFCSSIDDAMFIFLKGLDQEYLAHFFNSKESIDECDFTEDDPPYNQLSMKKKIITGGLCSDDEIEDDFPEKKVLGFREKLSKSKAAINTQMQSPESEQKIVLPESIQKYREKFKNKHQTKKVIAPLADDSDFDQFYPNQASSSLYPEDGQIDLATENNPNISLTKYSSSQPISDIECFANAFLEKSKNDGEFINNLVKRRNVKHHAACVEVLHVIIQLAKVVTNLSDIKDILAEGNYQKVIQLGKSYQDNTVSRNILRHLKQHYSEKIIAGDFRIDANLAIKLMASAIDRLKSKANLPMTTIIKMNMLNGIKYDAKTDTYLIEASKAFNFIKANFDVEDKNAKKPDKRYLKVNRLIYGNYSFKALQMEPFKLLLENKPTEVKIRNAFYDSISGNYLRTEPKPKNEDCHKMMLLSLAESD